MLLGVIYTAIQIIQVSQRPYDLEFFGESYPVFKIASTEQLTSAESAWVFTVTNTGKNTIKGITFKFPQNLGSAFYFDKNEEMVQGFEGEKNLGDFRPSDSKSFYIWSSYEYDKYYQDKAVIVFDGGGVLKADFPVSVRGFLKWVFNNRYLIYSILPAFLIPLGIIVDWFERKRKANLSNGAAPH